MDKANECRRNSIPTTPRAGRTNTPTAVDPMDKRLRYSHGGNQTSSSAASISRSRSTLQRMTDSWKPNKTPAAVHIEVTSMLSSMSNRRISSASNQPKRAERSALRVGCASHQAFVRADQPGTGMKRPHRAGRPPTERSWAWPGYRRRCTVGFLRHSLRRGVPCPASAPRAYEKCSAASRR
jgi:hypothetical protein